MIASKSQRCCVCYKYILVALLTFVVHTLERLIATIFNMATENVTENGQIFPEDQYTQNTDLLQ